jgi:ribosomal protein S18 acetylase RimI-like enzyme
MSAAMAVGDFIFGKQKGELEVLDLRHFGAAQIGALFAAETRRWQQRLVWDYSKSMELLLEYVDGHILPGYAATRNGEVRGYTFGVLEGVKAVIGDVFAFNEAADTTNPICDLLLRHLIEMLQATPGVDRIESQLLLFPAGALRTPFHEADFRAFPRLFMMGSIEAALTGNNPLRLPPGLYLESWRPELYEPAAELIHRCYQGHMDANINDQYRSVAGSLRFLHNIVRFPGCGIFSAENSWVLRDSAGKPQAMSLSSRVHPDVGHVTQLCVSPQWRSHGLGRTLLQQTAQALRKDGGKALSLTVTEANHSARAVYDSLGYKVMHRFEAMVWDR